MRGQERLDRSLFSYVDLEARVPAKHPLRVMRGLVNASLAALDGAFDALYSHDGRPSIPPEHLLRATLLQLLYTIRSERQLVDRLEFDLLFRWPHPEPAEGCWSGDGRCRLRGVRFLEKPRPFADDGDREEVPGGAAGATRGGKAAERRAFFG